MSDNRQIAAACGVDRELIAKLVSTNPVLALTLVKDHPPLVPNSYSIVAEFETTAAGDSVEPSFRTEFYQDSWVQQAFYTVRREGYLIGSPYKWQADEYNRRNPYVDFEGQLVSWDKNVVTAWAQPLENIFPVPGACSPSGFMASDGYVFPKSSNMWTRFTLRRTLDQTELPYVITVTFLVKELQGCRMRPVSPMEAIAELKDLGYCG